jgi:polar amino acid transport system ATP-binding protein
MEKGRLIEQGPPAELLAPGARSRSADFCAKLTELMGADS